ncbi:MAG: hypothetical protein ABJC74_03975, partial [Gemmatimonadota bacterium]
AATNADLTQRTAEGRFRRDLLDRFGPFRIPIPPLRERKDEIVPLFLRFLTEATESGEHPTIQEEWTVDPDVAMTLLALPWPGNVRQLRKEARFAARLCRGHRIVHHEHLSPDLQADAEVALTGCSLATARRHAWARLEVRALLADEHGDMATAAARLKVGERRAFQILAAPRPVGSRPSLGRPRREK